MRLYNLPNGETVDLDKVARVSQIHVCKHDSQYNNYEVYFDLVESINIMVADLPRETFMTALNGS